MIFAPGERVNSNTATPGRGSSCGDGTGLATITRNGAETGMFGMSDADATTRAPRFWVGLIALIILLIFLYFYKPFETYLVANIPGIHFSNVLFWFASLVGVVGYVVAHWQSFRNEIFRRVSELSVENLVFDSLQATILIAVIFFAGATLQAVEILGAHLVNRGAIIDPVFGRQLLAIVLLVIMAILFFLLHHVVRAFRYGWAGRRQPPGMARNLADRLATPRES